MPIEAKIMKYKVKHSMKKALFVKNGTPRACFAIGLEKRFSLEDATKIVEIINNGRFKEPLSPKEPRN